MSYNILFKFIKIYSNIGKAVNSIFHNPDSVFVTAKAKDILFDGLPVDCTVTDFAGAAVCNVLKTEAKDLVPDGENRYKFSLFGGVSDFSPKKKIIENLLICELRTI